MTPSPNFTAVEDAAALRDAFKGFGSDAQTIIGVITKRSNAQRLKIASEFKSMSGKDVIGVLKSELGGNFQETAVALMLPPLEFKAKELQKAMSGLGTDEDTLIEILGVHTNEEVTAVREIYEGRKCVQT